MILGGKRYASRESKFRNRADGVTITEVLIVFALIAVLAVLFIAAGQGIQERVTEATCKARMKRIYHALDNYVKDNGHWPQTPDLGESGFDEQADWKWWYEELLPYGIGKDHWLCPVEEKELKRSPNPPEYSASFIPTEFDDRQMTPYRWNQPWLMERGDFHKKGNHMVYPDGSIITAPTSLNIAPE